jgi:toxin ParE1/3/4
MATVIVSKEARKDLINIRHYIREELYNPDAASRIIKALRQSIDTLKDLPERGTPLDAILSVHTDYRFLVCEKYCIFFHYYDGTVEVIRVLHQLQNYMNALFLS